jgi:hypothetical protein
MADDDRANPQGKRKLQKLGGKLFPKVTLKESIEHAKKLYNKTMAGPQPASIILAGVFGSAKYIGKVRASSAKQYGLLEGDVAAYKATSLAKSVSIAAPENLSKYLQEAFLRPLIFNELHATFVGDQVTKAKIREQAGHRGVHAENLDRCVDIFSESLVFAGLGESVGDEIKVLARGAQTAIPNEPTDDIDIIDAESPGSTETTDAEGVEGRGAAEAGTKKSPSPPAAADSPGPSGRSVIHVNLTLDSTMDTDKLEKQLALLRKFGAL